MYTETAEREAASGREARGRFNINDLNDLNDLNGERLRADRRSGGAPGSFEARSTCLWLAVVAAVLRAP
jgi:hypothetical protein